jgi:hypothetical protein
MQRHSRICARNRLLGSVLVRRPRKEAVTELGWLVDTRKWEFALTIANPDTLQV